MTQAIAEKRVLVIDDDPEIRMLIEDILKIHHYQVTTAFNGLDAIKKSKETHPDIILLDICMPVFSGYWFCDAFKKRPETHDVPVVIVSGLSEENDIKRAYQLGASGYLTKPFTAEDLLYAIQEALPAE